MKITKAIYDKVTDLLDAKQKYSEFVEAFYIYGRLILRIEDTESIPCFLLPLNSDDCVFIIQFIENKIISINNELKEVGYYD